MFRRFAYKCNGAAIDAGCDYDGNAHTDFVAGHIANCVATSRTTGGFGWYANAERNRGSHYDFDAGRHPVSSLTEAWTIRIHGQEV